MRAETLDTINERCRLPFFLSHLVFCTLLSCRVPVWHGPGSIYSKEAAVGGDRIWEI